VLLGHYCGSSDISSIYLIEGQSSYLLHIDCETIPHHTNMYTVQAYLSKYIFLETLNHQALTRQRQGRERISPHPAITTKS
jgi:exosome complex RNA-binding protein Rrp42 (RNase PH superfamily)